MKQRNLEGEKIGLHFTHNDADAVGCGLVTKFINGYEFHTVFCAIDEIDDKINNIIKLNVSDISSILITDISIGDEVAKKLNNFCIKNDITLMMIDHHVTNYLYKKYTWAKVIKEDENGTPISAAKLLFNYCKINNLFKKVGSMNTINILNYICEQISRYDTWEWKNHPKKINDNIGREEDYGILVSEFGCDRALDLLSFRVRELAHTLTFETTINNDAIFINYLKMIVDIYKEKRTRLSQKTIDSMVKTHIMLYNALYTIALFLPDSEFANFEMESIYEDNKDIDFVMGLYPKNCSVSLRARKDININLADIARQLSVQGGGHEKAAGARLPYQKFLNLMNLYYEEREKKKNEG